MRWMGRLSRSEGSSKSSDNGAAALLSGKIARRFSVTRDGIGSLYRTARRARGPGIMEDCLIDGVGRSQLGSDMTESSFNSLHSIMSLNNHW